jgi:hypothetical protein
MSYPCRQAERESNAAEKARGKPPYDPISELRISESLQWSSKGRTRQRLAARLKAVAQVK